MNHEHQPSGLERYGDNLPVDAAVTVIAALAGGPLAALLPVLAKSLASGRQKKRVELFLSEVSLQLESHERKLHNLSDEQYKILNESILSALQTTEEKKLEYLRKCVANSLNIEDVAPHEAVVLSRFVRELSGDEAQAIVLWRGYRYVYITSVKGKSTSDETVLEIGPSAQEVLIVQGLRAVGVLTQGAPTLGQMLEFSPLRDKLVSLLQADA